MSKQDNKVELKPAKEFSQSMQDQQTQVLLKSAREFDDADFHENELSQLLDNIDDKPISRIAHRKSRMSKLAKWSLIAFATLIATELGISLYEIWQQNVGLFSIYIICIGIIAIWVVKSIAVEYQKLKKLKNIESKQHVSHRLSESMQTGEAEVFIASINLAFVDPKVMSSFRDALNNDQNDREKMQLFESVILTEQDQKAKKIVHKYAAESALILAVSPFALLDMMLILLRNQKMLNELAQCYGIELGYVSRLKLIKQIISNVIFAGGSEVITDIGGQLLSLEMTGKLSAKLGQGLAGGLLTARLGYQTMRLCRPVAFSTKTKPRLRDIHKVLISELIGLSKTKSKG
ncbi:MAG: TIGR01620 family protein [Parashewanella sp.]